MIKKKIMFGKSVAKIKIAVQKTNHNLPFQWQEL